MTGNAPVALELAAAFGRRTDRQAVGCSANFGICLEGQSGPGWRARHKCVDTVQRPSATRLVCPHTAKSGLSRAGTVQKGDLLASVWLPYGLLGAAPAIRGLPYPSPDLWKYARQGG